MAAASGAQTQWSSRFAFLMASVGFAVGLGNIWRFPYVTGENGGAAFVLIYLACAFGIGVPILMAELLIGRRGQGSPTTAMATVAVESGKTRQWRWVGGMGLLAAYTIEIVYAVVVGWVLWYLFKAITTGFVGVDAAAASAEFAGVLDNNLGMVAWTLVGMAITGYIIYSGVQNGIEPEATTVFTYGQDEGKSGGSVACGHPSFFVGSTVPARQSNLQGVVRREAFVLEFLYLGVFNHFTTLRPCRWPS